MGTCVNIITVCF